MINTKLLEAEKMGLQRAEFGISRRTGDKIFDRYKGYFDAETCRLEPLENPFAPKLLPMSPAE